MDLKFKFTFFLIFFLSFSTNGFSLNLNKVDKLIKGGKPYKGMILLNKHYSLKKVNLPEKVLELYLKGTEVLSKHYISNYEIYSEKKKKKIRNALNKILRKLAQVEFEPENDDSEGVDDIRDLLDEFQKKLDSEELRFYSFIKAGFLSFKDKISLSQPTGGDVEIHSTAQGTCWGGGLGWSNFHYGYNLNGCYGQTRATVGNDTSSLNYFQKDVSISFFQIGPELFWKPGKGNVLIGIYIPYVRRQGDYTDPGGGYFIQDKTINTIGVQLNTKWKVGSFAYSINIGKILKFSSILINLDILFYF